MKARYIFAIFALAFLFSLLGCGYAERLDPNVYTFDTPEQTAAAASKHAVMVTGTVRPINCCGSMLPLIQNGDLIVIAPVAFTDRLLGRVVVYRGGPAENWVHRLAAGTAEAGFIASGDNNAHSEAGRYVTAKNFVGEVVGIYRTQAKVTWTP